MLYANGKRALGLCDVCGFPYKLKTLKPLVVKGKKTGTLACVECWNEDHPQLKLGQFPIYDPQALRDPRSDSSELAAERQLYDQNGNPVNDPVNPGDIL